MHGRKDGWMAIEFAQAGNILPAPQRTFFPSSISNIMFTYFSHFINIYSWFYSALWSRLKSKLPFWYCTYVSWPSSFPFRGSNSTVVVAISPVSMRLCPVTLGLQLRRNMRGKEVRKKRLEMDWKYEKVERNEGKKNDGKGVKIGDDFILCKKHTIFSVAEQNEQDSLISSLHFFISSNIKHQTSHIMNNILYLECTHSLTCHTLPHPCYDCPHACKSVNININIDIIKINEILLFLCFEFSEHGWVANIWFHYSFIHWHYNIDYYYSHCNNWKQRHCLEEGNTKHEFKIWSQ